MVNLRWCGPTRQNMAEGVGKAMQILSRVPIPDGADVETEGAAAKGKPGEKPPPKKGAGAT